MATLFNADHQAAIVDHGETVVLPGGTHEFTDEEVEAGITGSWSPTAPPPIEEAPKKDRGKKSEASVDEAPEITAEAGEQKES